MVSDLEFLWSPACFVGVIAPVSVVRASDDEDEEEEAEDTEDLDDVDEVNAPPHLEPIEQVDDFEEDDFDDDFDDDFEEEFDDEEFSAEGGEENIPEQEDGDLEFDDED